MKKQVLTGTVLASALLFSMSASAGYMTFSGEDLNDDALVALTLLPNSQGAETSFKSNLTAGVATEDFENQSGSGSLALSFKDLVTGAITMATLDSSSGNVSSVTPTETNGAGRYSIPSATSSRFWEVSAGGGSTFTVTFSEAIAAFGFYGIDIGDFGGTVSIDLLGAGNAVLKTIDIPHTVGDGGSTDGSVIFFGVLSDGAASDFLGLSFRSTSVVNDVFAFDNFTIATRDQVDPPTGVPLPGTLLLAGLGLLGLGAARRRQS